MITLINSYKGIEGDTAIAIGKFDGLHVGHELILNTLGTYKKQGLKTVLLSFDPSPDVVFWRMEDSELLSRTETDERLARYEIDYHVILSFTPELAMMSCEDFLSEILLKNLHVKAVVAGEDVSFGYKGRGDAGFLMKKEKEGVLKCRIVKKRTIDGILVSSSIIRDYIKNGQIEQAARFLGYRYSFTGTVEEGKHLGRTYGIPTVNFYPEKRKVLPPFGVYFTRVKVKNQSYYAMTNIGIRPSVENRANLTKKGANFESYLFGEPGDLYGEICTVTLYTYHRAEIRFESLDGLIAQLQDDKKAAMEYFDIKE